MKKFISLLLFTILKISASPSTTQSFLGTSLIHMPSTKPVDAQNLEVRFNHRFGSAKSGLNDLFGLDSGANVSIGADYGFTQKASIGLARISDLKTYEGRFKYQILNQSNTIPFSFSFYGALGVETENQKIILGNFLSSTPTTGNPIQDAVIKKVNTIERELNYSERSSYLSSFLISRKFSDRISIQLSPMYVHRNFIKSNLSNDRLGISIGGRIKITKTIDLSFETIHTPHRDYKGSDYQSLDNTNADGNTMISGQTINTSYSSQSGLLFVYYNNVIRDKEVSHYYVPASIGLDFEAGGHVFQIFISNNKTMAHTQYLRGAEYDYFKKDYLFGFNLSRVFSFEKVEGLD